MPASAPCEGGKRIDAMEYRGGDGVNQKASGRGATRGLL